MQTLVGPVVQDGAEFSLSPTSVEMKEGETVELAAKAGGAQKIYWSKVQGDDESVIATDRFNIAFDAGRVTGDRAFKIRFDAVYADGVRSVEIPVTVKETVPEPEFALIAPADWDGRKTIEIQPEIKNLEAMQQAGVGELDYHWEVSGLATLKDEEPGKLVLQPCSEQRQDDRDACPVQRRTRHHGLDGCCGSGTGNRRLGSLGSRRP